MHDFPWRTGALVTVLAAATAACSGGQTAHSLLVPTGGNAHRGKQVITQYRCGVCHTIPGIPDANGVFAPPLTFF